MLDMVVQVVPPVCWQHQWTANQQRSMAYTHHMAGRPGIPVKGARTTVVRTRLNPYSNENAVAVTMHSSSCLPTAGGWMKLYCPSKVLLSVGPGPKPRHKAPPQSCCCLPRANPVRSRRRTSSRCMASAHACTLAVGHCPGAAQSATSELLGGCMRVSCSLSSTGEPCHGTTDQAGCIQHIHKKAASQHFCMLRT